MKKGTLRKDVSPLRLRPADYAIRCAIVMRVVASCTVYRILLRHALRNVCVRVGVASPRAGVRFHS